VAGLEVHVHFVDRLETCHGFVLNCLLRRRAAA
jgi:hypothetical protein